MSPAARSAPGPLGVVYTPPALTVPMVRLALAPLVAGKRVDQLLALRVCDPACGDGAFLVEVVAQLAEAVVAAGGGDLEVARAQVGARCVHGLDIDADAVQLARRATGAPAAAIGVGNALAHAWPARFDLVLGNPPYIRQEHLVDKAALGAFASYSGVADLYVYFIELAHRIGRRYCFVTPNKWLTAEYGRPLRTFLAAQGSVEGVVDLGTSALFDVAAYPCVVWGTVGASPQPIRASRADARCPAALALAAAGMPHPRSRWAAGPWHIDTDADRDLLDRLARDHRPFGTLYPARPSRGVVTGCNRAFVIDRTTRRRLLDAEPTAHALIRPFVRGRDLRAWSPAPAERFLLVVERGTDLAPYPAVLAHLAQFRAALEPRPAASTGPWAGRKVGRYQWFELQDPVGPLVDARGPRILIQDIQSAPLACLDVDGERVPDTTVWMLPTADRVLLAVLNSPVYGWYASRRFPPALHGAVRPKLAYLRELPVPTPAPPLRAAIVALVDIRRDTPGAAPELDTAIAERVADAYDLTVAERALITRAAARA